MRAEHQISGIKPNALRIAFTPSQLCNGSYRLYNPIYIELSAFVYIATYSGLGTLLRRVTSI